MKVEGGNVTILSPIKVSSGARFLNASSEQAQS